MENFPTSLRIVTLCGSIKPFFSGTDDYDQALTEGLQKRGIEICPVNLGRWDLLHTRKLLRTVAAAQPDAILMQYPTDSFGRSLGPQTFSLLQRVAPLVVTLHEFTASHWLRRLSTAPLLARAAVIVMTAEQEAKSLVKWYPWLHRRVRLIQLGANAPSRMWTPGRTPSVVYFGQIRPKKGLEDFIACRMRLKVTNPEAEFIVMGSPVPQFAAYFDKIAAELRARDIALLTNLDKESVSDRLAAASVALLPYPDGASFRRGSLLAAAVCGLPIVTRTGASTPPALTELLAPATTIEEMTALAEQYLKDPTARRAAHERSRRLGASVGWDAIADEYSAIFCGLCGIKRHSLMNAMV